MPRRRFYIPDLQSGWVHLDEDESRHARKVLRLQPGDAVELFDGSGTLAAGRIAEVGREVEIEVTDRRAIPPLRPVIDLAVALPKGARIDVLVEKASELGADRLIPISTERSVVEARPRRLERMDRLAIESAKQCGRAYLMQIDEPTDFEKLLAAADHPLKLIADTLELGSRNAELGTPSPLPPRLSPVIDVQELLSGGGADRVLVLIGPEGGWTEEERIAARNAGFRPWRLGPNVLRVETAAMAALAILRQHS